MDLLFSLSSDAMLEFIKILDAINCDGVITIKDSRVLQQFGNGNAILNVDISPIVGKNINLHIINPPKSLKLFKSLSKQKLPIEVFKDDINKQFVLSNGKTDIFLAKSIKPDFGLSVSPDLTGIKQIGSNIILSKSEYSLLSSMLTDCQFVEFLIRNNVIQGINFPKIGLHKLVDSPEKENIVLRSYTFLPLTGDNFKLTIGIKDNKYWLCSMIAIDSLVVTILEILLLCDSDELII